MANPSDLTHLVAALGFALAFVFGAVAQRTHFCTMGAVADIVGMGHWGRMRMWLLAIAVAIVGANALQGAGLVDLSQSIYPRPRLPWLSYVIGGLCFGIGMTLASGCGNKTLVRIGGGSLKALVVFLVLGISAYMTLRGLFGALRVSALDPVAFDLAARGFKGQDLPSLLNGEPTRTPIAGLVVALLMALALLIFVFKDREFRSSFDYILGGVTVGLLVSAGWCVTGHIGYGENPETLEHVFFGTNTRAAESFSFVAPVAYTLELLMLWTDQSLVLTFGIASVLGVIAGSAAYAVASKKFRWESFTSVADMRNHIFGGVLMGFGGVTSMGCTIGQGISGFSTLALGSMLTFAAIVAGAALTMKYQYARMAD